MLLCALIGSAQRTTRRHLRPANTATAAAAESPTVDTVKIALADSAVTFSGYEKTLRATKESFFVTNRTDSAISALQLRIVYSDMRGRQLDSRDITADIDLPPHSTRRVDLPAWDRQKVFYYHRSHPPRAAAATPYRVNISLLAALHRRTPTPPPSSQKR